MSFPKLPMFTSRSPLKGCIKFEHVSVRYDHGLPLALQNISFVIDAGQKVGIIGRTGSGKSSLFQTLLRAVEVETGRVLLDGVNVASLDLHHLRSQFAIIPQSPFLFTGTVAENMSLDGLFSVRELSDVARLCRLESLLDRLGGFEGRIEEMGGNLSFGEKQLICIARALLRRPKIVLIDEATAHVDEDTDACVQSVLKEGLPDCTVVTIAHRLFTLANYDKVIVLDQGKVVSQGSPVETLGL